MSKTTIVLPNGDVVQAKFMKADPESDFTGSPVEDYLGSIAHFVFTDDVGSKFAIAANAVMIKL